MVDFGAGSESLWTLTSQSEPLNLTRTMSWFDVMNRASGEHYDAVRERIDEWWRGIEGMPRKDLGKKLRSGRDEAAHAALAELFLMNEFAKNGHEVSMGNLGKLTPDLHCVNSRGEHFVVEVATLNPDEKSASEQRRIDGLLDALDNPHLDRSQLPRVMLNINAWSIGKSSAPTSQIVKRIHEWLQTDIEKAFVDAVHASRFLEEEPTLWWVKGPSTPREGQFIAELSSPSERNYTARTFAEKGHGWVVSFNCIPIGESNENGISLNGRVGISQMGHARALPPTRLPKIVKEKTKKYGLPCEGAGLPLIVAIGDPEWLNPSHHDLTQLDQVFNGRLVEYSEIVEDQTVTRSLTRRSDGLWQEKQTHRLCGVIVMNTQRWQWGEFAITAVSMNPRRQGAKPLSILSDVPVI